MASVLDNAAPFIEHNPTRNAAQDAAKWDGTEVNAVRQWLMALRDGARGLVNVETHGARPEQTTSYNFGAIQAALAEVCDAGGGTLVFPRLYDIGANTLQVYDQGNIANGSVIHLKGLGRPHPSKRATVGGLTANCGLKGSGAKILQFGNGSVGCGAQIRLEDFAVHSGALDQVGIDLTNLGAADPYITCDMDNVSVLGFEGTNAVCIDGGKNPDAAWNNVYVAGNGTQPGIGIRIQAEYAEMVNVFVRYCRTGLYIPKGTTYHVRMTNGRFLMCNDYSIYFEGGATGSKQGSSLFTGCFIGESTASAVNHVAVKCGADAGGLVATFVGCTFDRNGSSPNNIIDWNSGTLTLIGNTNCLVNGDNVVPHIKVAGDARLQMIGNSHFRSLDQTGQTAGSVFCQGNFDPGDFVDSTPWIDSPVFTGTPTVKAAVSPAKEIIHVANETAGQLAGVWFKSALNPNPALYAKGGVIFENDGSGYARGKVHIVNYGGTGDSSADASHARITVDAAGRVILPGLPASATGLPSGALWNDGGVLKVAP